MPELIENEELVGSAKKAIGEHLDKFKVQRKDYEDIWEVANYMRSAAQNRSLNLTERKKGVNTQNGTDSEQAQTGSTLFHRVVSQGAAQGYSIQTSMDAPFKYKPVINDGVLMSGKDGSAMADQWNCVAKWTMKQDNFDSKSIDFWTNLKTYGNLPVMIHQQQEYGIRTVRQPVYETSAGMEGPVSRVVDYTEVEEEYMVKNYPSLTVLAIDSMYADLNIGSIQGQDCVVIASLHNKSYFYAGVRSGYYDAAKVESISKKHRWDGTTEADARTKRYANSSDVTHPETATDQYLTYDVFHRSPIDGDKWDEEAEQELYWYTLVGNTITGGDDSCVCIRLDRNEDPDDEIPIEIIHANPGENDRLYHVADAEIVRSNYSVECTLKNLAIDNSALANRPPLKILEGAVRGTDFTVRPNKTFVVDMADAVQEFTIRDISLQTVQLLEYIQSDTKQALALDNPMMGESFGARTSATEASNVNKNSMQPHLMAIKYVLDQLFLFYGRKMRSYWRRYAEPGQVLAISDEAQFPIVYPEKLYGEFDVDVNIVDRYSRDMVAEQKLQDAIRLVAEVPSLEQYHDMPALLTEFYKQRNMDFAKFVKQPANADATEIAHQENIAMMQSGQNVNVRPGENKQIHLAEHKGERVRYKGLEQEYPNVTILDQHIAETEQAVQQEKQGSNGSPQAASGNKTEGQAQGNEIAGALGAAMGG